HQATKLCCVSPDRDAGRSTAPTLVTLRRSPSGRSGRRVRAARSRRSRCRPIPGGSPMTVAIYARVSSDSQEARGTIGSQLEALRQKMAELGQQVVHEYIDDGYSGARLDRPVSTHFATPPKPACSS